MTVTDLQRQQAKTPRHTTKTKTWVKAASNTSILTGGKACTKVSIPGVPTEVSSEFITKEAPTDKFLSGNIDQML